MPLLGHVRICQRCYDHIILSKLHHIQSSITSTTRSLMQKSFSFTNKNYVAVLPSHSQLSHTTLRKIQRNFSTIPSNYSEHNHGNPSRLSDSSHWENTFLTSSRAMTDYLLDMEDLKSLNMVVVRSAHENLHPIECYLKSDVEKRAIEVWGSWEMLQQKLDQRQLEREDERIRLQERSSLLTFLKTVNKDRTKKICNIEGKEERGKEERMSPGAGSAKVVLYAILSNFAVFVFKLLAYFHTGSASMLSETIHSLADMLNQCLLAYGIALSIRAPDPDHPYGWSRARYVYSLISGVGIFFIGAGVTCYHGFLGLLHPHAIGNVPVAFLVLGASLLVEGFTLFTAFKQVRKSAQESGVSFKNYVLRGRDPSAVAVLMEDSAAIAGIVIAGTALGLTHITGNVIYDAVGSISIGALMGITALFLVERNSNALVEQSMPQEKLKQITDLLESDVMIRSIHDVKATDIGADSVRFKAEVNFDGLEIARVHVNKLDLEKILMDVKDFDSVEDMEKFLLEHGKQVVNELGAEVDRIELKIKKQSPEVRHVDLEIL